MKSRSAAKPDTFSASPAVARRTRNGSILRYRCDSSPANAGISTPCASCLSPCRPAAPGEVLIEVKAAGMNFRDVLKALALYPGEAPDARIFGDEVAGVVKAVGAGVDACGAGRPGLWPCPVRARFAYAGAGRRCAPHSRRALL